MEYRIRTAVPADERRIRELFLEMLRTIYHTNDLKGYETETWTDTGAKTRIGSM